MSFYRLYSYEFSESGTLLHHGMQRLVGDDGSRVVLKGGAVDEGLQLFVTMQFFGLYLEFEADLDVGYWGVIGVF